MKLYTYLIILVVLTRLFTSKRIEPYFSRCVTQMLRNYTHGFRYLYAHRTHFLETWLRHSKEIWICLYVCVQTLLRNCLCPHSVSSAFSKILSFS